MANDKAKATEMLDEAESAARDALCDPEVFPLAARENMFALKETRIQEARAAKDRLLAVTRSQELVELDPLDPRPHIHLGDALFESGATEPAVAAYMTSASLGAPYTPRALSLAGHCWESVGEAESALECYMRALRVEPCAVITLFRAHKLANVLGRNPLKNWTGLRLQQLRDRARLAKC